MDVRDRIAATVGAIQPADAQEAADRQTALDWIASDAPIFRIRKPDLPPRHLVSYMAIVDRAAGKILLGDHRGAGRWLPCGGHVEPDENPRDTAIRELREELFSEAEFLRDEPAFITVTQTVGASRHCDVSLWYVLAGDSAAGVEYDRAEFSDMRWFSFAEIPLERSDPQMPRFIAKLRGILAG